MKRVTTNGSKDEMVQRIGGEAKIQIQDCGFEYLLRCHVRDFRSTIRRKERIRT
jgi:hypothetical protein